MILIKMLNQTSKRSSLTKVKTLYSGLDMNNLSDPQLMSLKRRKSDYYEIDLPQLQKLNAFDQPSLIDQINNKPSFQRIQKLKEKIILSIKSNSNHKQPQTLNKISNFSINGLSMTQSNQSPIQMLKSKLPKNTFNSLSKLDRLRSLNNADMRKSMRVNQSLPRTVDLMNLSGNDDHYRFVECRGNNHSEDTYPLFIDEKQYLVYCKAATNLDEFFKYLGCMIVSQNDNEIFVAITNDRIVKASKEMFTKYSKCVHNKSDELSKYNI